MGYFANNLISVKSDPLRQVAWGGTAAVAHQMLNNLNNAKLIWSVQKLFVFLHIENKKKSIY